MDPLLTDAAIGFAAGGTGQLISNVFGFGKQLVSGLSNAADRRTEAQSKADEAFAKTHKGRFPGWLTGTIFIMVVFSAFYGIYLTGLNNMPTTIGTSKEPWLNLFGIFRVGGGVVYNTVEGMVIPEYIERGTILVLSAITAIKAFKT